MSSFYHLEMLINAADSLNITRSARNALFADKKKIALLKLAILLHDTGKPASRTIDKKGDYHFYGHAAAGADMSKKICDRLKMSSREKCFIDFIIPKSIFIVKRRSGFIFEKKDFIYSEELKNYQSKKILSPCIHHQYRVKMG